MKIWEIDLRTNGQMFKASDGNEYQVYYGELMLPDHANHQVSSITKKVTLADIVEMDFEPVVNWDKVKVDTLIKDLSRKLAEAVRLYYHNHPDKLEEIKQMIEESKEVE